MGSALTSLGLGQLPSLGSKGPTLL